MTFTSSNVQSPPACQLSGVALVEIPRNFFKMSPHGFKPGLVDGCPSNPTELDPQPNLGSGIYIYYDCYLPPELNIQYKLQQRSTAVKTFKPLFHLQLLYFSLLPQGKNNKKFQTCQALPKVTVSNHHFVSWPEII